MFHGKETFSVHPYKANYNACIVFSAKLTNTRNATIFFIILQTDVILYGMNAKEFQQVYLRKHDLQPELVKINDTCSAFMFWHKDF